MRNPLEDAAQSLQVLIHTVETMAEAKPGSVWMDLVLAYRIACFATAKEPLPLEENSKVLRTEMQRLLNT